MKINVEQIIHDLKNPKDGWSGDSECVDSVVAACAAILLEWRPLTTAPRDRTHVELRGDSGTIRYPYRVVIASYENDREQDWDGIRCGTIDNFCWRTVQGDHVTDDGPMPTHWRPVS